MRTKVQSYNSTNQQVLVVQGCQTRKLHCSNFEGTEALSTQQNPFVPDICAWFRTFALYSDKRDEVGANSNLALHRTVQWSRWLEMPLVIFHCHVFPVPCFPKLNCIPLNYSIHFSIQGANCFSADYLCSIADSQLKTSKLFRKWVVNW